jgi:hypothetical protein
LNLINSILIWSYYLKPTKRGWKLKGFHPFLSMVNKGKWANAEVSTVTNKIL